MGTSHGDFTKYPRTPHLFGSKGTDDDKHLGEAESKAFIADESLIVEEKIDGTNVGIHFSDSGEMVLQCRGHLVTEGMHPQYDLFKQWAAVKRHVLETMLQNRFLLFGEWVYARHSIHYRKLTHYFFEFDIFDKEQEVFLDLEQSAVAARRNRNPDGAGGPHGHGESGRPRRPDRTIAVRQPIREPDHKTPRQPDGRSLPADRSGRHCHRTSEIRASRVRRKDQAKHALATSADGA